MTQQYVGFIHDETMFTYYKS